MKKSSGKGKEVISCQFSSWYETFRTSPKLTPKSVIIPIPPSFKKYLLSDGVRLPSCCENIDDGDGFSSGSSCSSQSSLESEHFSFPEITESITNAISDLGGAVFPKLNWSSPRDAAWVNNESLKCRSAQDVYILLKSSDFIVYDLEHALGNLEQVENYIVLRSWCNLHKSMEFRCFVKDSQIVAISQRNHTQFYQHLSSSLPHIEDLIWNTFENDIVDQFSLTTYVFDCYIDTKEKVWVIDFNIWDPCTDALLFTWEELENLKQTEVRAVERDREVKMDPLASYRAPIDTVSLASSGDDNASFEKFMKMCERRA